MKKKRWERVGEREEEENKGQIDQNCKVQLKVQVRDRAKLAVASAGSLCQKAWIGQSSNLATPSILMPSDPLNQAPKAVQSIAHPPRCIAAGHGRAGADLGWEEEEKEEKEGLGLALVLALACDARTLDWYSLLARSCSYCLTSSSRP